MAGYSVTGDQSRVIDKRMCEIKRQLNQKSGSPLNPEAVACELQRIIEGRLHSPPGISFIAQVNYEMPTYERVTGRLESTYDFDYRAATFEPIESCRDVPRQARRMGFEIIKPFERGDRQVVDSDPEDCSFEAMLSTIDRLGYRPTLPEELLWFGMLERAYAFNWTALVAPGALSRGANGDLSVLSLRLEEMYDGRREWGVPSVECESIHHFWESTSCLVTPK